MPLETLEATTPAPAPIAATATPPIAASAASAPEPLPATADSPLLAEDVASTSIAAFEGFLSIVGAPEDGAVVLGQARAGQRVALRATQSGAIRTPDCPGGYHAVEPRGYACLGPHATLASSDARVEAASEVLPDDDADYPLHYGYSRQAARYRHFPGAVEQRWNEPGLRRHLASTPAVPAAPPSPALLDRLTKPDTARSARAAEREGSKVAWAHVVRASGRTWVVTPDMILVPRDRVEEAEPVAAASQRPGSERPMPFAFVPAVFASRRRFVFASAHGGPAASGAVDPWTFIPLSGERRDSKFGALLEAVDGSYIRAGDVSPFALEAPPLGLGPEAKWVSVHVGANTLVAYEGARPVFAAAVSTGAHGSTSDGEHRTNVGRFRITSKWLTQDMAGRTLDGIGWRSPEVPFVAYYDGARALHGAWWHDWFGRPRSHGCINLTPADARWLFEWLDPALPDGWYSVTATGDEGTTVVVRP